GARSAAHLKGAQATSNEGAGQRSSPQPRSGFGIGSQATPLNGDGAEEPVPVDERREIERFYRERLRRFGARDARCLGFTRDSQRKRFEALCDLGDLDRRRLLDVGCGLGDLLPFLLERGVRPFYSGLDLCGEMISRCRTKFRSRPDVACHFEVGSVLKHEPAGPYDFVVSSGMFGCSTPRARERIGPSLERMFSWCTEGMAVNFLSAKASRREGEFLYVDPAEAIKLALRLTPVVRMRHDYLPNDFTLYLYRNGARHASRARRRSEPRMNGLEVG
ncbi:MAG: class I SAM-dependent methyltransferase, partial [Elusimicrobia bacterium]|nr:class I SAM-dependent methyltransferase [Elusimicrobiota bacterium]